MSIPEWDEDGNLPAWDTVSGLPVTTQFDGVIIKELLDVTQLYFTHVDLHGAFHKREALRALKMRQVGEVFGKESRSLNIGVIVAEIDGIFCVITAVIPPCVRTAHHLLIHLCSYSAHVLPYEDTTSLHHEKIGVHYSWSHINEIKKRRGQAEEKNDRQHRSVWNSGNFPHGTIWNLRK